METKIFDTSTVDGLKKAEQYKARGDAMTNPIITRLSTGYWHVRWCADLWIQFPVDRQATLSDGFGWITSEHVRIANKRIEELNEPKHN
jgi:hypothetical protein